MTKNYILILMLIFISLKMNAQTTLNGRFYLSGVSDTPTQSTSNYSIEGTFTDPQYVHNADEILIGDVIADGDGKLFKIDLISTHVSGSSDIIVDVTYLSGAISEWNKYPSVFTTGTLFHPTSNGYPLITYDAEYDNKNLMVSVQNAAILAIDANTSGYKSGTQTEMPTSPKLGDGFFNTTEKKLYIYNGTDWMGVGSGVVPTGTSTEFPNPANAGEMFFNTEDNSSYIYNGTIWLKISTNGSTPSGIFNPDPATVTVNEGGLFYNTSDHKLYVYNGTVWMPADNILPNGQIYVGNTTNIATPVSMSGDATINNSGKLTIKNGAVTDDKLDKLNIPLSGFGNPTDNVSFGDGTTNNRVVNLANPTGAQDAATKNYVDALFTNPTALLTLPSGNLFVGNMTNKAVATAKSAIPLSGFGAAAATISLGDGTTNNKISNLLNPVAAQDAATKNYVDTRVIDPSSITLASASLLVGNSSGKAAAVAKNTILLSGFGVAAADISLGDGTTNFKIVNLANPLTAQDAATKYYVDSKTIDAASLNLASQSMFLGNSSGKAIATLKSAIPLSGFGTTASDISFGNFKITNLATPLSDTDAATKKYIDDLFLAPATSLALASGKIFIGNSTGKAVASATSIIPVSGFGKATSTLNMGDAATQFNISYLAEPLYPQDAATKSYVDSKSATPGTLTLTSEFIQVGNTSNVAVEVAKSNIPISDFGAATAGISLGNGTTNFKITNLADPTTDQEAATKKYVDTKTASTQSGGTLPSTGQQVADTYYSTTDNRFYVYNGTTWVPVDNALADGKLYVGNSSGIATATAKNTIPLSGFAAAAADLVLGNGTSNFKITNLADPTTDQEAATKKYVDAKTASTQNGVTIPTSGETGDTFYSTTDQKLYIYNGTSWVQAANDNLGNHTATTNLKMETFSISTNGVAGAGLSFDADNNAAFGQNVTVNGNFYTPSDQRLKTNIETISSVLRAIDQIRGVRFEYKDQKKYATGPKIGVIAQELQKVYPEMVSKGTDGFLKVDYTQLTGVLIQAIKEQQLQIKHQQQEINSLKVQMNSQQVQIDAILKKMQ